MIAKVIHRQGSKGSAAFGRAAGYITRDGKDGAHKVEWIQTSNCVATAVSDAIRQCRKIQERNTRASNRTYHFVLSFRQEEAPSKEMVLEVERRAIAALGLEDHQRISAFHTNTENKHLHVVVNLIHPETLKSVQPAWDHLKLDHMCQQAEIDLGLAVDTRCRRLRENNQEIVALPAKARTMEAHAGIESFLAWVKEQAGPTLVAAAHAQGATWATLQAEAAKFGVAFRTRGAGLVLAHLHDNLFVKASDVGRALSRSQLEAILGPFKDGQSVALENNLGYHASPKAKSLIAQQLYADFSHQMAERRKLRQDHWDDLRQWHQDAKALLARKESTWRQVATPAVKRAHGATRRAAAQAERMQLLAKFREAKRKGTEAYPVKNWLQWLIERVNAGDENAKIILMASAKKRLALAQLSNENGITLRSQGVQIQKDGYLTYALDHGGQAADDGRAIHLLNTGAPPTDLAIQQALLIAAKGCARIRIDTQDDSLRQRMVNLAADLHLEVQCSKNVNGVEIEGQDIPKIRHTKR